jgi:ketosteroid isomerase-like protein
VSDREALQAAIDCIKRRDYEALLEHVHSDFVGVVPPSMSAEPDSYLGHEGVKRYFALFEDAVDDLLMSFEIIEERGEWTLAYGTITGQGRASGIPFDATLVSGVLMRDGKIARMDGWPTLEEAREALAE